MTQVDKQHTLALLILFGASSRLIAWLIVSQGLLLAVLGIATRLLLQQLMIPMFPRRVLLVPSDIVIVGTG